MPIRTCVGCRARRDQDELLRLHLDDRGHVRRDREGGGRGAWLCRVDPAACLDLAIDRRALARAFRRQPDPSSVDALRDDLAGERRTTET